MYIISFLLNKKIKKTKRGLVEVKGDLLALGLTREVTSLTMSTNITIPH